jgi:hypothetical protein
MPTSYGLAPGRASQRHACQRASETLPYAGKGTGVRPRCPPHKAAYTINGEDILMLPGLATGRNSS